MKVIVRCANNRVTKADMEREIERLFQENKDLRLSESHLKDELNLVSQQSEVRRQKMVEKDKEIDRMRATIANVGAERDDFEASYKRCFSGGKQHSLKQLRLRPLLMNIALPQWKVTAELMNWKNSWNGYAIRTKNGQQSLRVCATPLRK